MARLLTYYVGASVDGFIAGPEGDLDLFPVGQDLIDFIVSDYPETLPTHIRSQLEVDAPNATFDTIIQGRATYDAALEAGIPSPYAHLRQYVASRTLADPDPAVTVIADDLVGAVRALKEEDGLAIYLAGGGEVAGQLMEEIDELVVKRYPVIAGAGTPMLSGAHGPLALGLVAAKHLEGGTVIEHYARAMPHV